MASMTYLIAQITKAVWNWGELSRRSNGRTVKSEEGGEPRPYPKSVIRKMALFAFICVHCVVSFSQSSRATKKKRPLGRSLKFFRCVDYWVTVIKAWPSSAVPPGPWHSTEWVPGGSKAWRPENKEKVPQTISSL